MKFSNNKKVILLLVLSIICFLYGSWASSSGLLDSSSENYMSQTFVIALVSTGAAQLVEMIIIAAGELGDVALGFVSSGSGQPSEILQPLEDTMNVTKNVLLTATTSLGIQLLAYYLVKTIGMKLVSILLLVNASIVFFKIEKLFELSNFIFKIISLILIIYLAFIFTAFLSSITFNQISGNIQFEERVTEAIKLNPEEIEELQNFDYPESTDNSLIPNFLEKPSDFATGTLSVFTPKAKILASTVVRTNYLEIVELLFEMTIIWIVIFFLQVIFYPILSLYLLVKTFNKIFGMNYTPFYFLKRKSKV